MPRKGVRNKLKKISFMMRENYLGLISGTEELRKGVGSKATISMRYRTNAKWARWRPQVNTRNQEHTMVKINFIDTINLDSCNSSCHTFKTQCINPVWGDNLVIHHDRGSNQGPSRHEVDSAIKPNWCPSAQGLGRTFLLLYSPWHPLPSFTRHDVMGGFLCRNLFESWIFTN